MRLRISRATLTPEAQAIQSQMPSRDVPGIGSSSVVVIPEWSNLRFGVSGYCTTWRVERFGHIIVDTKALPGLVCTMSPAGEVDRFNPHILEYFGKTPDELKGWAMSDAVHPDDVPRVIAAFTHSITTGSPYDIEHRCRRRDGVYRWFQVRALPVRDTADRITGWYVLLTDIDDRKRAEDAIRASERNLKQIINTIPALAWSARPDGSAEFFNQHYLDYVGLSAEQAKDWGWTVAVHPDDLNDLIAAWRRMIASDQAAEYEGRLRRFDGEYRWFLFRTNPLRDESNKTFKWYGTNTESTIETGSGKVAA